jgi:hypothetical protein
MSLRVTNKSVAFIFQKNDLMLYFINISSKQFDSCSTDVFKYSFASFVLKVIIYQMVLIMFILKTRLVAYYAFITFGLVSFL